MSIEYNKEEKVYYFECPHCSLLISVPKNDIACKIFRHGVYKKDGKQIPPHSPKNECDRLAEEDLIYGCGKPFHFDGNEVKICGYI